MMKPAGLPPGPHRQPLDLAMHPHVSILPSDEMGRGRSEPAALLNIHEHSSPLNLATLPRSRLRADSTEDSVDSGSLISAGSASDEETILTNVFFQTSTHLFSIYTGSCNPFMRLKRHLSGSKALRLAVQAMAAQTISGYQSTDKAKHMDRGLELQRLAYRELSIALTDPISSLSDSTFAAVVHIGMTEPWHSLRSDQSGAMHLRTSKVLICQRVQTQTALPPRYLCNLLLYWDLLVSLHSDSSHEEYSSNMLLGGNHSEDEPIDYIDPTVGLGVHLFHEIVEMEHFLRFWRMQSHASNVDSPQHLEMALGFQRSLSSWRPDLDATKLLGCTKVFESTSLQDILFTAEAYRQTALLLLYRMIPEVMGHHDNSTHFNHQALLSQMASDIMKLLSAILISSPVCTTHEWILFVTAPDVASPQEREFVRDRMSGLLEKIGIIGIKEVMEYIEDVWEKIDRYEIDSSSWMDDMHERQWYPLLG